MSQHRTLIVFLIGWPSAMMVALASRVAFSGTVLSTPEYVGWIFLALTPVFAGAVILRGRSRQSISQVLSDLEGTSGVSQEKPVPVSRG